MCVTTDDFIILFLQMEQLLSAVTGFTPTPDAVATLAVVAAVLELMDETAEDGDALASAARSAKAALSSREG